MNKATIIAALLVVVGVGAYYFIGQTEKEIETQITEQLLQQNAKAQGVDYSLLSNELKLNNVEFNTEVSGYQVNAKAEKLSIAGIDYDQLTKQDELIFGFEELNAEMYALDVVAPDNEKIHITADSLNLQDYTYNHNDMQDALKDSDYDVITALIISLQGGLEIKNYAFSSTKENSDNPFSVTFASMSTKPKDSKGRMTFAYSDFLAKDSEVQVRAKNIDVDDAQLELFKIIVNNFKDNGLDKDKLVSDKELQKFNDDMAFFSKVLIQDFGVSFSEKVDPVFAQIKDKEITMEELEINMVGENGLSYDLKTKNFAISSEYLTAFDDSLVTYIGKGLPEQISIDYSINSKLNSKDKTNTLASHILIKDLFETASDVDTVYTCNNAWDVVYSTEKGLECMGINSVKVDYKDSGLVPLLANIVSDNFGMPVELMLTSLKGNSAILLNQFSKEDEKTQAVIKESVDATIALIEKPGNLSFEFSVPTPLFVVDLDSIPTDYNFSIKTEQGEKTLQELLAK